MVNEDYQPTDQEDAVLEVLKDERRVNPLLVREQTGLDKGSVNTALTNLRSAGWVKRVTRGLYDFVDDPRDREPKSEHQPDPRDAAGSQPATAPTDDASRFSRETLEQLDLERDLTDDRAEVLLEFLAWVAKDESGIQKGEYEAEFWSEAREAKTGYNAGSFWEAFAKAAMTQLSEFTKPNARTYRYRG